MADKAIELYKGKGKMEITFDPIKHVFRHMNGNRIDGVTSATGKIDKSGALMGWAIKMMGIYLKENWLSNLTRSEFEELVDRGKKEYRRIKEEAANIGTEVHEWAEAHIKGKKKKLPSDPRVRNGVIAFMKWFKETDIKITASERYIYSKKHDYAGIMDWEGELNGELVIGDFKTSKGIYNEMRYQLAAYWMAREEESGKKYMKGFIVQFGKEDGEFHIMEIPRKEYLKDRKIFLAALAIKRREEELKKKK